MLNFKIIHQHDFSDGMYWYYMSIIYLNLAQTRPLILTRTVQMTMTVGGQCFFLNR